MFKSEDYIKTQGSITAAEIIQHYTHEAFIENEFSFDGFTAEHAEVSFDIF